MPIIKSAKKKLRQDKKRTLRNEKYKKRYKSSVKESLEKKGKDAASTKKAYSQIDKAAKKGIIHKNKAARLKSRVARKK